MLPAEPRFLFFTGKGGVGKTSVACASALSLADRGRRVLLVSTDPASNLDEVLGTTLGAEPRAVRGEASGRLFALNVDPVAAAAAHRERVVGPYRGVLPDAAVVSIEEQLSGACTVEMAAFDVFAGLLAGAPSDFDHVVFDTAPTGHTLRLLELPGAWTTFLEGNVGGASCLGPLAGLASQATLYRAARAALVDATRTAIVLVARPETATLEEADRTRSELVALGAVRQRLVLNGVFVPTDSSDPLGRAIAESHARAIATIPPGLAALPLQTVPLLSHGLVGLPALARLRAALEGEALPPPVMPTGPAVAVDLPGLDALAAQIGVGDGVLLTMGKGGVGKTRVARALAERLARSGRLVHLTTTDPAARGGEASSLPNLRITRIDPVEATRAYTREVLATAGKDLDDAGRALLEEDLRSPCTEEIAVFRAFARVVAEGEQSLVIVDTAPTGHTLLLLDAAETYHREVLRSRGAVPDEVRTLLPHLRDPDFTRIVLVTLAEATPVHEAMALEKDLARAGIVPFAWVVQRSLLPLVPRDPVLVARRAAEAVHVAELDGHGRRVFLNPWELGS